MANDYSQSTPWTLAGTRATLAVESLRGVIDLAKPELGIQQPTLEALAFADRWLGVALSGKTSQQDHPLQLKNSRVRGADLIADYTSEVDSIRVTLYWRVAEVETDRIVVDLDTSISTDALESRPKVVSRSGYRGKASSATIDRASNSSSGFVAAQCTIATAEDVTLHAAEFPEEPHATQLTIDPLEGPSCVTWLLSEGFLERGVVRRTRLRSIVRLGSAISEDEIVDSASALSQLGPPLTA